jgi:hypothetical protein
MKRTLIWTLLLTGLTGGALAQQAEEREKLAQTGMKFLSVSLDPRAAAMGDAVTASEGGAALLFYNPASIARQEGYLSLALGQVDWIADIQYNQAALALRPGGGRFGVVAFSVLAVDYGELQETIRADNDQGFLDLGTFSPTAFSAGVGYARALTDRFSIGGHAKYVRQNLGSSVDAVRDDGGFVRTSNEKSVMAYDFGVLYKTGFRSLNFAFSARNFAQEIAYEEENFQLPLTLKIGLSMDVTDLMPAASNLHRLRLAVDAENPRDFSEQIKVGGEYVFMDLLSLRAGYVFPTDEQGINLGVGLHQKVRRLGRVGFDYAYTNFGVFSNVNRVAFSLSL